MNLDKNKLPISGLVGMDFNGGYLACLIDLLNLLAIEENINVGFIDDYLKSKLEDTYKEIYKEILWMQENPIDDLLLEEQ